MKKKITVGILAHVDAGKTTCIESMLFQAKTIRKLGRVDHKDAYLDYDTQERDRGITIFSKEVHFEWNDTDIFLIDTPGHIDFSSEMERTLQILDMAVLFINGQDGVQSHTQTIWKCLEHYHIPTLIFINKMDISYHTQEELMENLQKQCSDNCINFLDDNYLENVAMTHDSLLNEFMETQNISNTSIQEAVQKRELFPCFFGSALKNEGIDTLMNALSQYSLDKEYGSEFGAKVFKISQDEKGNRLTHIKITSGTLHAKDKINEEEKVDQIRIYNGKNYEMVPSADAGTICVLKGIQSLNAGQGMGIEEDSEAPLLNAYMSYQLLLPEDVDPVQMMKYCQVIAQEDPQLHIEYNEALKIITLQIMGDIQMQILQQMIQERSGVTVGFGSGKILFKETIEDTVTGVGHFEPLRHYAEVHVKLEPLPRGTGMQFESDCTQDELAYNWQRLILTHLQEKEHRGVLTGSAITDIKITLIAGKAHLKHTEGGDFRQATYRAVRQGLMKAKSILLEPYYSFTLELPQVSLSKALYDLDQKQASVQIEEKEDSIVIKGKGPVRLMANYQAEVVAFTKGQGKYSCHLDGYYPCKDAETIIEKRHYDPEKDRRNPTGSVFCTHGSGFYVPYDEVENYMHIQPKNESSSSYHRVRYTISEEEAKRVFNMTSGQNKNEKKMDKRPKKKIDLNHENINITPLQETCLIVDGYNQIFGWESLKDLARQDYNTARDRLIDILVNYQAYKGYKMILVFDAYRVKERSQRDIQKENTTIVYTKYGQTADSYIEKLVHDLKKKYRLIVASNDGLIQNSIFAQGAQRMSSRELELSALRVNQDAMKYVK